MKKKLCQTAVTALIVMLLARYVVGQNNPYRFSSKAVESVPNILQRANSPNLSDRISVLEQLIIKDIGSDVLLYKYAHNLPPNAKVGLWRYRNEC